MPYAFGHMVHSGKSVKFWNFLAIFFLDCFDFDLYLLKYQFLFI